MGPPLVSRCWYFYFRHDLNAQTPIPWVTSAAFICWQANRLSVKSKYGTTLYSLSGYIQFTSARHISTLKQSYSSHCKWSIASACPGSYNKILSKSQFIFGKPIEPLKTYLTPYTVKYTADSESNAKQSAALDAQHAACDLRLYFNKIN